MNVLAADSILRELHGISDGTHNLVDDPAAADLILLLVTNRVQEWSCVLDYQIRSGFDDDSRWKTFVISSGPFVSYTHQGVYTSAAGWASRFGSRVRCGAYNLISERFKNPFVKAAEPGIGLKSPKKFLFSFIGRDCHGARTKVLEMQYRREDVLVRHSSDFDLWTSDPFEGAGNQAGSEFFDSLVSSKFVLCPAGTGPNSIRLFECLKLGVVPVVISDQWLRPVGPDWDRFCIFVKESELDQLENILEANEPRYHEMGERALHAYGEYFSDNAYFNFLVSSCADIQDRRWLPEKIGSTAIRMWRASSAKASQVRMATGLRTRLRKIWPGSES